MKNICCPILLYTAFTDTKKRAKDVTVHITKFEHDINTILSNGYTPVSLTQLSDAMYFNSPLPVNPICVVLFGGYKNQYEFAYPILLKYGVHADFFVATELIGATSYPGITNFAPHFGWGEANEMHSSKLVDIYALWHPFDNGKDYDVEINKKIHLISSNVPCNNSRKAFFIEMQHDTSKKQKAIEGARIALNLVSYYSPLANRFDKGHVPYIDIKQESSILDTIDTFVAKYNFMFNLDTDLDSIDESKLKWNPPQHSITLPIQKDPPVKNLLRNAIPLSVVGASRADKYDLIVLNDFIDIIFHPWYHFFDYDNHHYACWPELTCCRLEKDFIKNMGVNAADLVINGLATGYYVDAWIDEFYIPGKNNYNIMHSAHNILIYGYEHEHNVFQTLTYTKAGYYEELEVAASDFIKSSLSGFFVCLQFLKSNPNYQLTYDIHLIKKKLKAYVESEYEYSNNTKHTKYDRNQLCNYNACLEFGRYIKTTAEKEGLIYLVCFCGYLEHKKCMGWRLNYLAEKEGLDKESFSTYLQYSKNTAEHLVNLALKYNMSKNKKLLCKIVSMVEELNKKELEIIMKFLSE